MNTYLYRSCGRLLSTGSEIGRNPQFCEDNREKTMKFVIYGRENCSFCKRAVELAKQLQGHGYGEYQYIDIVAADR